MKSKEPSKFPFHFIWLKLKVQGRVHVLLPSWDGNFHVFFHLWLCDIRGRWKFPCSSDHLAEIKEHGNFYVLSSSCAQGSVENFMFFRSSICDQSTWKFLFFHPAVIKGTWKFPCSSYHLSDIKEHGNFHVLSSSCDQRSMVIPMFFHLTEVEGTWKFPCPFFHLSSKEHELTWKFPCSLSWGRTGSMEISMPSFSVEVEGTWNFPCFYSFIYQLEEPTNLEYSFIMSMFLRLWKIVYLTLKGRHLISVWTTLAIIRNVYHVFCADGNRTLFHWILPIKMLTEHKKVVKNLKHWH